MGRRKLRKQLPAWVFDEDVSLTKSEKSKIKSMVKKGAKRFDKENPNFKLPKKKRRK